MHRAATSHCFCSGFDNVLNGSVFTARDVPGAMMDRVVHLRGVTGWPEIKQVREMLGGAFDKALHPELSRVSRWARQLRGHRLGAFRRGRPGGRQRIAVVLLRSTLGVFGCLIPPCMLTTSCTDAAVPVSLAFGISALQKLLNSQPASSSSSGNVNGNADFGTATFWQVTRGIAKLVQKEKQIALLILCREADKENAALQQAQEQFTFISLKGLNDDSVIETCATHTPALRFNSCSSPS